MTTADLATTPPRPWLLLPPRWSDTLTTLIPSYPPSEFLRTYNKHDRTWTLVSHTHAPRFTPSLDIVCYNFIQLILCLIAMFLLLLIWLFKNFQPVFVFSLPPYAKYNKVKHKQPCPGFELGLLIPFPMKKLCLPRQKWTLNETLIFFKIVSLIFNTLNPLSFLLAEATETFLLVL